MVLKYELKQWQCHIAVKRVGMPEQNISASAFSAFTILMQLAAGQIMFLVSQQETDFVPYPNS